MSNVVVLNILLHQKLLQPFFRSCVDISDVIFTFAKLGCVTT
jgi:hypothetical protein